MSIDPQIIELGVRLADALARNTAISVSNTIGALKVKHNDQETINQLSEIITNLISDKDELAQIAQAYQQEFVIQQITPEEIEYITEKFIPVLKTLIKQTSEGQTRTEILGLEKGIDALMQVLSVEMLTVLQLVGFNFKKALGEPLTDFIGKFITSRIPTDQQSTIELNKLHAAFSIELAKVAQHKDASDRWERLRSM